MTLRRKTFAHLALAACGRKLERKARFGLALGTIVGVTAIVGAGACGGELAPEPTEGSAADASLAHDAALVDAMPIEAGDANAHDASVSDADVPDTAPPVCAPVTKGCIGVASCGTNSEPMPMACAAGTTCEAYCRARMICQTGGCRIDGGSFECYSCNP